MTFAQMFIIYQGRENNSTNHVIISLWLLFNMKSRFNFTQKYPAMADLKYLNITSKFSQRDFRHFRPELGPGLLFSIKKKKQRCVCYYQCVYQRMIQSIISTENQTYGQYYSGIRWPHNHNHSMKYKILILIFNIKVIISRFIAPVYTDIAARILKQTI